MNTHLVVFIALMLVAGMLIGRLFWRYRTNYPLQAEAAAPILPDGPVAADPVSSLLTAQPGTWGLAILGWQAMMIGLAGRQESARPPAHLLARMQELGGPQAILAARDAQEAAFDATPAGMILSGADDQEIDPADLPALEAAARAKARRLKQRARIARLVALHPESERFEDFLEQEIAREARWRAEAQARMATLTGDITARPPGAPMAPDEWDGLRHFLQGEKCRTWRLMRRADDGIDLERSTLSLWDLFQRGL